ncbi:sensor histidine kinase [Catenulispora pinisilvae]|uniref:sensor histidine kinase n=1 Tax=Catenulispora pinisilvae TaxID=2705253 RepID=UPI002B27B742|nr:HAMP domain-containing sensor histidine kinase [Catenulispora pinisilvae]
MRLSPLGTRLDPRTLTGRLPFRARLATSFAGLFLVVGAALLAFVVVLARHGTVQHVQGMDVRLVNAPDFDPSQFSATAPSGTAAADGSPRLAGTAPAQGMATAAHIALVQKIDQTVRAVQDTALREMVLWSAIGLVVLALVAGVLGWRLAGRALRPVAAITGAARQISEESLHQRLSLTGPDDELHRLADTFDTMLDRLEKSFESQRRFVANASHELKTPLAVQRTCLQVGFADPLPDGLAEVREDMLAANHEAEQLINALLLLARSDRGVEATEPVELGGVARLAAADLAPLAATNEVGVEVFKAAGPMVVHGDPILLRHLLTNLTRNAVQYNRRGGFVDVRLDAAAATLTVSNTGPHVSPEKVLDLFEPFRRHGPDRTAQSGHGLGLSIARSIAEAHGAELTAHPRAEGGLVLTLCFRP